MYTNHSILALRLYGLYRSKRLGYFLLALLCISVAAEVYILIVYAPDETAFNAGPTIGSVCVMTNGSKFLYLWYVISSIVLFVGYIGLH